MNITKSLSCIKALSFACAQKVLVVELFFMFCWVVISSHGCCMLLWLGGRNHSYDCLSHKRVLSVFHLTSGKTGDTAQTKRLFDAILAVCIPVILSDEIFLPYEAFVNWREIAIFIPMKRVYGKLSLTDSSVNHSFFATLYELCSLHAMHREGLQRDQILAAIWC